MFKTASFVIPTDVTTTNLVLENPPSTQVHSKLVVADTATTKTP